MCGIAGYSVAKNTLSFNIQRSKYDLAHRGPDDSGEFYNSSFGIGLIHTRLSIQDLSLNGHQPIISDAHKVVLVFNGEIYNFRELRDQLSLSGCQFKGDSDTEVLLNLYIAEGKSMMSRLNGIFSFAIWDPRIQELFIARDAVGVKPLYYYTNNNQFLFASELKAIMPFLSSLDNVDNLDAEAIQRYLTFLWCPGDGTPIKCVRKLSPGEAIVVQSGMIVKQWYWHKPRVFSKKHPLKLTSQSVIKGTHDYLQKAVHRQMIADVPVGAFLSGGLDSSAVVAFARQVNPNIRCFTIETSGNTEQGMVNDLPYAKNVANHLGVKLDVVNIDAEQMANDLQKMVIQLDEPLADLAPLNVLYISQLARSQGIKVLLSGAGGDDLFSGYRRHLALTLERYWTWLPLSVRSALEKASSHLNQARPVTRRISKLFNGASLPDDERLVNYFRWIKDSDLQSLYSTDFKIQLASSKAEDPMYELLHNLPTDLSPLDRMLSLEQRFFLADHNLIYTDKMSMAAGVEVRVPFLDNDLVEFSAQIPAKYKQRGKQGKWVLKKAMEPYLPHDVIYRPKTGFGAPLRSWMRFELRELLGDLLSEESLSRRGLFDPKAVQQLISENDAGTKDASYTLLSLLCIEVWCRAYLDKSMPT